LHLILIGQLLKLHLAVKQYLEEEQKLPDELQPQQTKRLKNQKPREFGSDGGGVVYTLGSRLPPERGSSDLKPAVEHKSGQSEMNEKQLENFFIARVAKFACACINQRCNGTIYFGVGDNKVYHLKLLNTKLKYFCSSVQYGTICGLN
jgi:hypothetical protein